MSFKRHTSASAAIEIESLRRHNGSGWVDCEFARRFTGSAWEDVWVNIPNLFVTCGEAGTIAYSADGLAWTKAAVSPAISNPFHKIRYINGYIVATSWDGINGFYVSKNGKSFTKVTTPGACYAVAYGAGKWVASGPSDTFYYSTDLVNWTTVIQPYASTESIGTPCYALEFLNSKFIAVGGKASSLYQRIIGSVDGVNWGLPKRRTHSETQSINYSTIGYSSYGSGFYLFPHSRLDLGYIDDSKLTDTTTTMFSSVSDRNNAYRLELVASFEDGSRSFVAGQNSGYSSVVNPSGVWSTMNLTQLISNRNGDTKSLKTYGNTHLFVTGQYGASSSPYQRYPRLGYYANDFANIVNLIPTFTQAYGPLNDSAFNGSILVAVGKDTANSQAYTWRSVGLAEAIQISNTLGNIELNSVCWAGE